MTAQERIAEPAMAPSVYLSLRQAVRPASYAHFLLAEDQERAGQLAAECEDLFFLTRELLKALGDYSEATVKLIADLYEMPAEIAGLEYDNTIMKLETDGNMAAANVPAAVQLSLDLAKLGGLKDIVPAEDVISTKFKPVPTTP